MDIDGITALVQNYEYGQHNLGEQDLTVCYDPETKQLAIDDFYRHGANHKTGTCVELANTCYHELKEKYPDMHVFRVSGQEPRHFYESTVGNTSAKHYFLLLSPHSLTGCLPVVESPMQLYSIMETNPLVVDPSFQYVAPLEQSGYFPRKIIKPKTRAVHSNQLLFDEQEDKLIPLGFNERSEMAYLQQNWDSDDLLQVTVRGEDAITTSFSLKDHNLKDMFAKQPKLLRTFHRLARAPRTQGVTIQPETIIVE